MPLMESAPGPETILDGRRYLYFAGTGYLALQGHPRLAEAACAAVRQYGLGTATSRTGFGNNPPTVEVEQRAAEFFAADDAFYFTSGYVGTAIVLRAVAEQFDHLFVDEFSHYSIFEAVEATRLPVERFRHRDPGDLQRCLAARLQKSQRPLVVSDGVFAALGDIAPVAEYHQVLREYDSAGICLDDAHAVGVIGAQGQGTFEHAGLATTDVNAAEGQSTGVRLFACGTLSKAIGGYGGIIAGQRALIDQVRGRSHFFDGASAPPAPAAAATAAALQLVMTEPELRAQLTRNVQRLRGLLRELGLEVPHSPVPIIPLVVGDRATMQRIHQQLLQRGIAIGYFSGYSGFGAEGGLRIAVFATHTDAMLDQLVDALRQLL